VPAASLRARTQGRAPAAAADGAALGSAS
jgi:hypothetical protein